ncbi:hypothetical protein IFM89_008897 [Coptis chinensis]|uniref:Pentatricopeptide repeat-containing protein n=1 Tax=Coptis chinensis TaxID=261450 RepID=A0A835LZ04_9MAGN|nr:hypothetical protein IFM89_008897 [Coptis chinensis]
MDERGIEKDLHSYSIYMDIVCKSGKPWKTVKLYKEMKKKGIVLDVVAYNMVLHAIGRFRHAYAILDQMLEKGCFPNVITYHGFFGCLEKPKEMLKLFDRMIESGVRPRMDTYVMLLRRFGRWGFLRPVFIVWKKMEEHRCSPDASVYNAVIDALIQKNMVDMARKYDEEMLAKGLSAKPRKSWGQSRYV